MNKNGFIKWLFILMFCPLFLLSQTQNTTNNFQTNVKDSVMFDANTGRMFKIIKKETFDPSSGNMTIVNDTIWIQPSDVTIKQSKSEEKIVYDPITGLPLDSKSKISMNMLMSTNNIWSDGRIISVARINAKNEFNSLPWVVLGGPASCTTMILMASIGGGVAEGAGFLIGSMSGAIFVPIILSNLGIKKNIPYPETLPESQQKLYKKIYLNEIRHNRRLGILKGELLGLGIVTALMLMVVANL